MNTLFLTTESVQQENKKAVKHEIHGVAFDMDGLIFNTELHYKLACFEVAKEFDITITGSLYTQLVGTPVNKGRELFLAEFGDDFNIDLFQRRWMQKRNQIHERDGVKFQQGFEDIFDYFVSLNLPIALVTASNMTEVNNNFANRRQFDKFDVVISHDDPYPSKPAPDKYLAAAKKLGIEAKNMLVLEDSNTGMQAAINADAIAVMVPYMVPPTDDVMDKASAIYSNLSELHLQLSET